MIKVYRSDFIYPKLIMVAPNGEEYFKDIHEIASFIGVHSNPIEFKEMFCESVRSITEEDFTIADLDRFITKSDYKMGASMLSLMNVMVELNARRVTQGKQVAFNYFPGAANT